MSNEPVADIARAAAERLVAHHGPELPEAVEAALQGGAAPRQAADHRPLPAATSALIVNIARSAWTVYLDHKQPAAAPSIEALARVIRNRHQDTGRLGFIERNRIIAVTVSETLRLAQLATPTGQRHDALG